MWRVVIGKGVLSVFIQHFQVIVQANCVMYFVTYTSVVHQIEGSQSALF